MKSKKSVSIVSIIILFALVVLPAAANALDCSKVSVKRIGADPRFEGPPVQLKDELGTCWGGGIRQFYLSSSLGNQGLAVVLTGYSLNKTFWVRIADDAAPGSLVQVIFIND